MAKAKDVVSPLSETAPPKARKSKKGLIVIALLVLVTASGGFFAWRYFSTPPATVSPAAAAAGEESGNEESEPAAEGGHEGGTATESTILNFEPFLVNLADRDAFRYLRVTVRLQAINKAAAERVSSTEVFSSQIRDTILGILTTKTSEEIITPEGKDRLKAEIADKLNVFLPGKAVKAVFFTEFVVQL